MSSNPPPPPPSMAPIKLSFGPAKALPKKPILAKKAFKPTSLSLSDDDSPLASTSTSTISRPGSGGIKVSTASLSRAQKKKMAEEVEMNKEVYAYDEVWDNMKEGDRKAKAERMKDDGERKPKYISKLIETAGIRARDRVRAEDKMVQREREMEGAEFGDKDSFVTPAYKAQQEELRKVEEEEKKKEAANAASNNGLSSFYAQYLQNQSTAHDAAVAASLVSTPLTSTSTAPTRAATEVEIAARHLKKTGKAVEVNDEGVIIDKRQLLEGGLNLLSKPNERGSGSGGFSVPIAARAKAAAAEAAALAGQGGGLSAAERGRQSRERHSREVERQMVAMEETKKRDAEEELGKEVKKVAKRNDETKVEELKRKAQERRDKREQDEREAAAIAAAAPPE